MGTLAPPRQDRVGSGPPPSQPESLGGDGRGWVDLVSARNDIEAHLLTGRLNEAGIETSTLVDRGYPGAFLYGGHNPWAQVAILVRRMDLEAARLVLAEIAFEGPPSPPPGPRDKVRRRRGVALWWALAIALALLFTGLGFAQSLERCEQAGLCRSSDR